MNKFSKVLPVMAFLFAIGAAMLSHAGTKKVTTYYRWNTATPRQCVLEDECDDISTNPCGHMAFIPGLTSNCQTQVTLKKP